MRLEIVSSLHSSNKIFSESDADDSEEVPAGPALGGMPGGLGGASGGMGGMPGGLGGGAPGGLGAMDGGMGGMAGNMGGMGGMAGNLRGIPGNMGGMPGGFGDVAGGEAPGGLGGAPGSAGGFPVVAPAGAENDIDEEPEPALSESASTNIKNAGTIGNSNVFNKPAVGGAGGLNINPALLKALQSVNPNVQLNPALLQQLG